jgi:hypothetical protein
LTILQHLGAEETVTFPLIFSKERFAAEAVEKKKD